MTYTMNIHETATTSRKAAAAVTANVTRRKQQYHSPRAVTNGTSNVQVILGAMSSS